MCITMLEHKRPGAATATKRFGPACVRRELSLFDATAARLPVLGYGVSRNPELRDEIAEAVQLSIVQRDSRRVPGFDAADASYLLLPAGRG